MKVNFLLVLFFLITPLVHAATNNVEVIKAINSGSQFDQHTLHNNKLLSKQAILWEKLNGPITGSKLKTIQMKNANTVLYAFQASAKQVYRSIDNGVSWKILLLPQDKELNDLASIDDHKLILAADGDVFLSFDRGDHWFVSNKGIKGNVDEIHVVNSQLIFLITNKYSAYSTMLYRSTDGGKSWSPAALGLNTDALIWSLASRDNIILASAKGLNISTNHGGFWVQLSEKWRDLIIHSMALTSKQDIYLVTGKVFKTNISGNSWEEIPIAGNAQQIAIDNIDRIYLLTQDNNHLSTLYRSQDNAKTWERLYSLPGDSSFTVLTNGIILISSNKGLLMSDTTQTTFTPLSIEFSNSNTSKVFALDDKHLFAIDSSENHHGKLFRSEDAGHTWVLAYDKNVTGMTTFNEQLVIIASSNLILLSQDFGKTWQQIYSFADGQHINIENYAGTLLLEREDGVYLSNDLVYWQKVNTFNNNEKSSYYLQGNNIYVNNGNAIKVSKDRGKTWVNLLANIHRDSGLLKGIGSTLIAAFPNGGVIKSNDDGQHWQLINNGLLNANFRSLILLDEKNYWIATTNGVFNTKDGGENWFLERNGMTNFDILNLFANEHFLLAGSNGSGVYKAMR